MEEIVYASATALAQAIRTKEVSAEEVIQAYLRRIEAVNPKLNAVVQLRAEAALAEARQADADLVRGDVRGPLHGVPVTVKDVLATAGVITMAGTPGRASFVPQRDATVVARLRAAGAIILGKTNTPELCWGGETDNAVYGRANNPYNLSRSPGGSSGGEAAIIAAGGSPLGLGSDFVGSIRGPCHFCGIAGLNPTMGRVPRTGHIPPYGGAYDTARVGPMARFVEDLELVLPIIAGVDWVDPTVIPVPLGDPYAVHPETLRGAFYTDDAIFTPAPAIMDAVRDAAQALADAGATVKEDRPDGLAEMMEIAAEVHRGSGSAAEKEVYAEFYEPKDMRQEALREYATLWPQRARQAKLKDGMSAVEFLAWAQRWSLCRSAMLSFLEEYDIIICPVAGYPAQPHGFTHRDDFRVEGLTSCTKPYSYAGWPSAVVRAGTSPDGLPIGVQVVARPWREDVALATARHIETALGGWRPPPL